MKSNVTLLKPGTIVYSDDKAGQGVMKQIQEKSTKSYDYIAVPDEKGLTQGSRDGDSRPDLTFDVFEI